jgi:hypothetical protein
VSTIRSIWFNLLASIVAVTVASAPEAAQQPQKPNIVFMLADNLGYGELGVYGGGILRGAPTPRIDASSSYGTHPGFTMGWTTSGHSKSAFRAPRTMTIFSSDRSPARRDGDFGS